MAGPKRTMNVHYLYDKDLENKTARCAVCGPNVPIRIKKDKKRGEFAQCQTAYELAWRRTNKSKRHGLTADEAKAYLKDKVCRLCGKDFDLVVDHDPATNELRGALCRPHNVGIGLLGDAAIYIESVLEYLNGQEVTTPLPLHKSNGTGRYSRVNQQ